MILGLRIQDDLDSLSGVRGSQAKKLGDESRVEFTFIYERILSYLLVKYLCYSKDGAGGLRYREPTMEGLDE